MSRTTTHEDAESPEVLVEYRVCWSINRVGGDGHSDWIPAEPGKSEAEVKHAIEKGSASNLAMGFEIALEDSGFGWWVETREVQS